MDGEGRDDEAGDGVKPGRAGERTEPTAQELAALPLDERVAYFLNHPLEGQDPAVDPLFVARHRARAVETITRRDAEQAAQRHAS